MNIEIHGDKILTELEFHKEIARQFDVQHYYGKNLDALWDLLSWGVERPINLIWFNSNISKEKLSCFEEIVVILEKVKCQDEQFNFEERFTYALA
jgi:ribonuclease inhibitor